MWSPRFSSRHMRIPMAPQKRKTTKNEPTDRGMFHNSNRHCLGFITSSTHPSSIRLGCCHLIANSPLRLVSSQLSPRQKSWLWNRMGDGVTHYPP